MKSCIGFIFDLSCQMKNQFSDISVDINGDMICPYFPFVSLLSKAIDNQYDMFIGSCGVDLNYGKVCDIILLLKYLSNHEWLPKINDSPINSRQCKNEFIENLKNANAHFTSYIAEQKLSENKCKYLLLAFSNYPNIYDEIGNEERNLKQDQNISNILLQKIFPIFKTIKEIVYDKHKVNYDLLINDQYRTLINTVIIRVLRNYDWSSYSDQFNIISPQELTQILSEVYKKMPPDCQNSIYDAINTFFFSFFSFLNISLNIAYETFYIKKYSDRTLIIISNGTSSQEALIKANFINYKQDIKIFCCYLSKEKISDNPKQLYLNSPSGLDERGNQLFYMSSKVKINYFVKTILKSRGWVIPESRECRLFVHVNDINLIREFMEIVTDIIRNNFNLANVLGTNIIQKYISNTISNFKTTDQKREKICWAHACATVIHMATARIYGRKLPSFDEIRNDLLKEFGCNGQYVEDVFDKILYSKYKLRYKKVDEEGAKKAIMESRQCVATFYLTALQWYNFGRFFYNNNKGILTSDILNKECQVPKNEEDGGHAVVFINYERSHLIFLNSWGENWGYNGYFNVENSSVLNVEYYDVYWTENDLTPREKEEWENRKNNELTDLIWNQFNKSPETMIKCPNCSSIEEASSFNGNCWRCICPICKNSFIPTIKNLAKYIVDAPGFP